MPLFNKYICIHALLYGGLYLALAAGYGDLNAVGPAYIEVTLGKLLQFVIIAAAATWIARIYYRDPYKNRYKEYLLYMPYFLSQSP